MVAPPVPPGPESEAAEGGGEGEGAGVQGGKVRAAHVGINRRVRDDLPLTPAEHAAWKEWVCRPPRDETRSKREEEEEEKAS